jgi:hypothetical protein
MTNQMPPRSRSAIPVFQQNVSNETNSKAEAHNRRFNQIKTSTGQKAS